MDPRHKILSIVAAVLLVAAILSAITLPYASLSSAIGAFALSLFLRHRGAFRVDNTPLAGAFLIGGSAMMVLGGVIVVSPMIGVVVCGLILIPSYLFLLAFGIRERFRAVMRWIEPPP